ncbi:MAG: hypothetical protein KJ999_21765 [Gammaproteobacteria bacterium]|nr:hypothetical protein [Gammaproteobacteria bacterium]
MNYIYLIVLLFFCLAIYHLGRKIESRYSIDIKDGCIIVERDLVTQYIAAKNIKKIKINKNNIMFFGEFKVYEKHSKRDINRNTIDIAVGDKFNINLLEEFLQRNDISREIIVR